MKKVIKSLQYFRDLGGIKNKNGEALKTGSLFRTCELSKVSDEDKKYILNDLNVGVCIDFRAPAEVAIQEDVLKKEKGIIYKHIAVCNDEENPVVTKKNRIGILKLRNKEKGGMDGHLTRLYRLIISSPRAQKGYREAFDTLLDNKNQKAVVYHCTQGKDRTGIFSMLILIALGFSKESIIRDYMGYNNYHRLKRFWIFVGMFIVFFSFNKAYGLDAALKSKRKYIEAAFDEMKKFGTPIEYLKNQIGIKDEEISLLKELYLIKA